MILTTDQMDSTTPEDRRKLVAMCDNCGHWQFFIRKDGGMSSTRGVSCEKCQGTAFRDVISQRTFDAERAKKASTKWLKARKK